MLEGFRSPAVPPEDHYHPLVGDQYSISHKPLRWANCVDVCVHVCVVKPLLTLPASLSGRPESLSEDLPLVRLSREWQEVASYRASYGLSSSGPGASPEINSLTFSISPLVKERHRHTEAEKWKRTLFCIFLSSVSCFICWLSCCFYSKNTFLAWDIFPVLPFLRGLGLSWGGGSGGGGRSMSGGFPAMWPANSQTGDCITAGRCEIKRTLPATALCFHIYLKWEQLYLWSSGRACPWPCPALGGPSGRWCSRRYLENDDRNSW